MDKLRIAGAALQLKGRIKTTVGRLTGNKRLEASGGIDKAAGRVRSAAGKTKDTGRNSGNTR